MEEPMARRTNIPAVFETEIIDGMQAGTLTLGAVIAMAEGGHAAADHALRTYAATLMDQGRFAQAPVQLRAYVVKAMLRDPL
jgi:hypothetical protein